MSIATIEKAPEGLTVIRDGRTLQLGEGDNLAWGDEVVNNSNHPVEFKVPGLSEAQADSKVTMKAGSSAFLQQVPSATDSSSSTEVMALTDGIDIQVLDEELEASDQADASAMGGFEGAGLLAAGGAAALLAGTGGGSDGSASGSSLTAAASSEAPSNTSGINTPFTGSNDAGADSSSEQTSNPDSGSMSAIDEATSAGNSSNTSSGTGTSGTSGTGQNTATPGTSTSSEDVATESEEQNQTDQTGNSDSGQSDAAAQPSPSGVVGAINEANDSIDANGGEQVSASTTEPLAAELQAAAASIDEASDDPVTDGLAALIGQPDENYDPNQYNEAAGVIDSMDKGIDSALAGTQLEPAADITSQLLENSAAIVDDPASASSLQASSNPDPAEISSTISDLTTQVQNAEELPLDTQSLPTSPLIDSATQSINSADNSDAQDLLGTLDSLGSSISSNETLSPSTELPLDTSGLS